MRAVRVFVIALEPRAREFWSWPSPVLRTTR
jgi:hypothetical protein